MKEDSELNVLLKHIGKNVHNLRQGANEIFFAVTCATGISEAVLSKIENGRYTALSFTILDKLAIHYNVSIYELLKGNPPN